MRTTGFEISELKADKGELGGSCNRTACQAPGATWFNHGTRKHYCAACAELINRANRKEAQEIYGHELCTEVQNEDAQAA